MSLSREEEVVQTLAGLATSSTTTEPAVPPDSVQSQTKQFTKEFIEDVTKLVECNKVHLASYNENFKYYYPSKEGRSNRVKTRIELLEKLNSALAAELINNFESKYSNEEHEKNKSGKRGHVKSKFVTDYIEPQILHEVIVIIKRDDNYSKNDSFYEMVSAIGDCIEDALKIRDKNYKKCAEKHTSWLKFEKSWQYTFLNKISDLFLGEKNTSNILNKQLIHNIERLQELELKIDQRFFSRNVRTMMAYVFFPIVVDWLVTGYLDKVRLKEQAPSDPQLTSFKAFQDNINELDKQGILPMLPVILPVAGISALLLKKISDCKKDFLRFYEGSFQYYLDGGKNSSVVCNKKYSLYRSRMMLLRGLNQKAADSLQKKWKDFCSHEKSTLTKKMEFCQEYLEPQILLELISICCKTFANNEAAKSFCDMITMIGEILQRSLQSRTDQAGLKYTDLWQHKFLMEILKLFNDKKITSKFLDSELSANIKWLYEYNAVKKAKMISAWRRWQLSRIILPILIEYTVIGCLSEGKIEVETANACQLDSLAIFKDNVKKLQTKEMLKNSEIVMREAGANEVEEASVADVRLPVPTPVVPMLDTALLAQTLPPSSTPAKLSLLRSFQFFQETLPRRDGGAHKRPFTEMSDNEKPPTKQRYPYETFLESPRQPSPDVETVADQSEEFNKHHRPWEL